MTKRNKLRTSPARFFEDSRHPALRLLAPAAAAVSRVDAVRDVLEDPHRALAARDIPLLSRGARRVQTRQAQARRQLIAAHGTPRVSAIVAAHNAENTLRSSVASLLDQTHRRLEVIVVDDASRDGTAELANALASEDDRVRVLRHPEQRGAARARNTGLSAARGAYLTFQDADDRSHVERLERQLASLLATPSAAVCVCNFRRVAPDGTTLTINGRRFAKNLISMMFPRAVFERVGYLRPLTVGEDAEFYERIKAAMGAEHELHRFETLYFARFDPSSLLFSHGEVRRVGDEVTYRESDTARERREAALSHLAAIRAGTASPFVTAE